MLLSALILSGRIRRRDVILRVFPANTRIGPVNGVLKRGKGKGKREKAKGKDYEKLLRRQTGFEASLLQFRQRVLDFLACRFALAVLFRGFVFVNRFLQGPLQRE